MINTLTLTTKSYVSLNYRYHSKEYQVDVKGNQTFRQFFETNFINTFQVVSSEELTDFNQHLLDTQLTIIIVILYLRLSFVK